MLIPNSMGILKQLSIPIAAIWISVAVVLSLITATFFLSAEFFSDRVAEKDLEQLRAENEQLSEKYESLRWTLAEVENRYEQLSEKEIKIRQLFELPEISTEERQLGTGGPTSPMLSSMSPAERNAMVTEKQVDRLLRLSAYEIERYAEVEQALIGIKTRLDHTPSIWPTKGWFSRGFGMKYDPFTGYKRMHRGIDFASHAGTIIVAAADGVIKSVGRNGDLGKMVTIDHGYGFVTRYGHLQSYKVKNGTRVKRGDVIGLMGSTGYSTGPHLHYEVQRNGKALNPMNFILNDL